MLACDFLMHVRASRTISDEHYFQIERLVFGSGMPRQEQLDMLNIIGGYLKRPDPRWAELMRRADMGAPVPAQPAEADAPPLAKVA